MDFYRFSLSWARIIPEGNANSKVNEAGVQYYNNLIDALIAQDVVPMVSDGTTWESGFGNY